MLFGLRLVQEGEEFGLASLYIGERRYVRATDAGSFLSSPFGHCYPFRNCLIGAVILDFRAGQISSRCLPGAIGCDLL